MYTEYYDMYGQGMAYQAPGSNFGMNAMSGASGMQSTAYPDSYVHPFEGGAAPHGKDVEGAIPDIRFNPDGSAYFTIPNKVRFLFYFKLIFFFILSNYALFFFLKLVGAIIGKSGVRIRSIRYESGAEVQIENIKDASGQQRTVTVKGTEKQIQQACLLLQKR